MYQNASIQLGSGAPLTVPAAQKRVFSPTNPQAAGFDRIAQIKILVLTAGAHANFVVTFEGSFNGNEWYDILTMLPTIQDTTGVTLDAGGLHLTAARALVGMVIAIDAAFPRIRVGLSGDNAAPGGTAIIEWRRSR